jgi:hypothetical protein
MDTSLWDFLRYRQIKNGKEREIVQSKDANKSDIIIFATGRRPFICKEEAVMVGGALCFTKGTSGTVS